MILLQKIKYKVFFRRVSTNGQDLAMQESADTVFREQYLPSETLIIEEHGVSANKLKISERPKMQKLISMIKDNQVEVVYAFDRTRLFRDFYESNYFLSLCKKHNVRIFFTSAGNGHQQSTGNTLLEGVLNIVGDVEGKNIARRSEEARKRYPPRKLGYIKQKESKQYIKDPKNEKILNQFFSELMEISTTIELENILQDYKKKLKTNIGQLMKIANDPFYAGYELSTGENKLKHVAHYVTLEEFQRLQAKNSIFSKYIQRVQSLKEQNIFQPLCGICRKPMNFHFNITEEIAWYSCSRKHPKIFISSKDLTSIVSNSLQEVIKHLNTEQLLQDSRHYFYQMKKPIEYELKSITSEKNIILENIILENEELTNWRNNPEYEKLSKLENQKVQLLSELSTKQELLLENEYLTNLVKEYLNDCREKNLFFLISMLIKCLYIYQNEVDIVINKFDYVKALNKLFIFKGDELL
jgi:predicted site-specific integrase-resolvase